MTYNQLKNIAKSHIREGENLPSNAFLLLNQLHIPFKNERQCAVDFKETISPLKNTPAFLCVDNKGNKTIYFNSNTQYWNFYIFHEIAHYLLGHETNSPQNEIDADMLACILAAPIENFPTTIKTARDLSVVCKIPIDKAEMYWQEIKDKVSKWYKNIYAIGCMAMLIVLSIIGGLHFQNRPNIQRNIEEPNTIITTAPDSTIDTYNQNDLFYITSSGTHYHVKNCKHIKYKTNVIHISTDEVNTLGLDPCGDCIK